MTVCIAAICEFGQAQLVIVAADRMITAGDIQYQPPQSKAYVLTSRVVALAAGDLVHQSAICKRTFTEFQGVPDATVRDIAEGYARHFAEHRLKRNTADLLGPIGLTLEDFHKRLAKEDTAFVKGTLDLFYDSSLETETIIAGTDALGAHIFLVTDPGGVVETHDDVGFASIGAGAWHAESQFTQTSYSRKWPLQWAIFLVYMAMRRAQVAPGVGNQIDLYVIAQQISEVTSDPLFETLGKVYEEYEIKAQASLVKAYGDVQAVFEEYLKRAATRQQSSFNQGQEQAQPSPADEEGVPGEPEEGHPKG